MAELFRAFLDPDMAVLRMALASGVLASVAFGIVGAYVVVRRISYIAGAISHCVLAGIGAALFLERTAGWTWCHPTYGAMVSALAAAVVIGLVSLYAREREDTVIGATWAVGMAVGLLFLAKTPGYVDPMSYLFGDILLIATRDVWLVAGLDVVVLGLVALFYNPLLAICFDEEFARLRGVPVERYYLLLLCLTALTVVLLVTVVGIVMVVALLTLPAAVAGRCAKRLWTMMALGIAFCMVFVVIGLGCSYVYDLPSGPTIIVIAAVAYLALAGVGRLRRWRLTQRKRSP